MEAAIVGALMKTTVPKALSMLGGSRDVCSIQSELRYIKAEIQDHRKKSCGRDTSHLQTAWIQELTLFAFDIEECVELHRNEHDDFLDMMSWLSSCSG